MSSSICTGRRFYTDQTPRSVLLARARCVGRSAWPARCLLSEDTTRTSRHGTAEATHPKTEDDGAAGDGQIADLARVTTVDPARMLTAVWAATCTSGPAQINVHGVISHHDALDAESSQVGHRDRDAQGAPPVGSRSPERTSLQYYVSWPAYTESETEPVPD